MRAIFQPLFFLFARSNETKLIYQNQILQKQLEFTRKRVPQKKIFLDADEKQQLMDIGEKLGSDVKHVLSIVHYGTYLRWLRNERQGVEPKKMGRPRKSFLLRELILRFAEENAWGYTRILGELKKMRAPSIARSTVKNILIENGHDPGPRRGKGSWGEFIKIHADTLWQCDFFSKRIWTSTGLRDCFVLAFIHIGTRRVFVTASTYNPNAQWMEQQATAFLDHLEETGLEATILIRDMDQKYCKEFEKPLEDNGIKMKPVGPRAPNLNAFIERWIQSVKLEALNSFIIFGRAHLDHIVSEYVSYYHEARPHQSLGNRPLTGDWPREEKELSESDEVVCHTRLGGLLKHYERRAA